MRKPVKGAQFQRDVKLAQKRGKDMAKLREAILAAPLDDEPETEEERASVVSSLADASPDIPFEQLRRNRA